MAIEQLLPVLSEYLGKKVIDRLTKEQLACRKASG